jgi:hypothetical protein
MKQKLEIHFDHSKNSVQDSAKSDENIIARDTGIDKLHHQDV